MNSNEPSYDSTTQTTFKLSIDHLNSKSENLNSKSQTFRIYLPAI